MKKKSRFLQTPIEPFTVEGGLTADQILARMERISFQGRNLATAHRIWRRMLEDDVTIFLGMAGALSAGGLRLIVAHLIANRYVDCLGLDRRQSLPRPPRDARSAPLSRHRLMPTMRRSPTNRSTVSTTPCQRGRIRRQRHLDRGFRRDARAAAVHDSRVSLPARWASVEDDQAATASSPRPTAPTCRSSARRSPTRRSAWACRRRGRRVPEAGHIDIIGDIVESANMVIRRPRTASVVLGRRHAEELHQPGQRAGGVLQLRRSAAIATRCRS